MDNYNSSNGLKPSMLPPTTDQVSKYKPKPGTASKIGTTRTDLRNEVSPKPQTKHNFQYTAAQNSKIGSPAASSKHSSIYAQRCKSTRQRPQSPQYSKQGTNTSIREDRDIGSSTQKQQNAQREVNAYASNLSLRYAVSRQETLKQERNLEESEQLANSAVKRTKFDPKLHQKAVASKQSPQKGLSHIAANTAFSASKASNIISYSVIERDSTKKQREDNQYHPRARDDLNKTTTKTSEARKAPKRSLSKSATEKLLNRTDCLEGLSTSVAIESFSNLINIDSQEVPLRKEIKNKSYMLLSKTDGDQQIVLKQQSTPSSDSNRSHDQPENHENAHYIGFNNEASQIDQSVVVHNDNDNQGYQTQKTNKSAASAPRELNLDIILDFLMKEEEILYEFSLMANQGQLLELQQLLPLPASLSYLDMIQFVDCKKERPKFFSKQLQVTLLLVNSLMELFSPLYLQRFSHKFRTVYTNVHLNFLLYIDTMLNCCNINPNDNQVYSHLRKVVVKKLNHKQKAQKLTCFRQNNEVNLIIVKKICRQVIDQSKNENFFEYVEHIENLQEVLRSYEQMEYEEIWDKIDSFDSVLALQQKQALAKKNTFRRTKSPHPSAVAANNTGVRPNSRAGSPRLYSPRTMGRMNKIEMHSVSSPRLLTVGQSQEHGFLRLATTANLRNNGGVASSNNGGLNGNSVLKANKSMSRRNLSKNNSRTKIQDSLDYDAVETTAIISVKDRGQVAQSQQLFQASTSLRHQNSSNNFMLQENADFLRTLCKDADDSSTVIINDANYYSTNNDNNYSMIDSETSSQLQTSNYASKQQYASTNKPQNTSNFNNYNNSVNRPKSKIPRITSATSTKKATQQQQQQQKDWSQVKPAQMNKSSVTRLRKASPRANESINDSRQEESGNQKSKNSQLLNNSNSCILDDLAARQMEMSRESSMLTSVNNSQMTTPVKSRLLASAKQQKRPQSRLAQSSSKQSLATNQAANSAQKGQQRGIPVSSNKAVTKHNFQLGFMVQKDKLDASQLSIGQSTNGSTKARKDSTQINQTQTNKSRQRKATDSSIKKQQPNITGQSSGYNNAMSKTTGSRAIVSAKMIESQQNSSKLTPVQYKNQEQIDQQQLLLQSNETKAQTSINGTTQNFSIADFESDSLAETNLFSNSIVTPQKKRTTVAPNQDYTSNSNLNDREDDEMSPSLSQKGNILDSVFQLSDNRLDSLLRKMEQPESKKLTALDLKMEMDKLKQLDIEQKMQKRIKLNIDKQQPPGEQTTEHVRLPTSESPSKKRFLGEFDDTKKEFRISLGEDMLLNKRTSRVGSNQYFDNIDDLEDPFLDQQGDCGGSGSGSGSKSSREEHISIGRRDMPSVVAEFENAVTTQLNKEFSEVAEAQEDQEDELDEDEKDKLAIDEEQKRLRELVSVPFLPPLSNGKEYTLVLDLDETLIHFDCDEEETEEGGEENNSEGGGGGYYLIRPHCLKFLQEMSKYYDLVIFTAAMPDYADWILDNVDKNGIIKHRLYRQHTTPHEDYAIKDLHNLGRPIEKTIIIDNLAENFIHTTPDNGIWVESWYDDMDDTVLEMLIPFLKDIVRERVPDVRHILTKDIKEKTIYRCLEEGSSIPPIGDLLNTNNVKSPFAKDWNIDDLLI